MTDKEKYPRYPGGELLYNEFRYKYNPTTRTFTWVMGEDGQERVVEIITLKVCIGRLVWRILNYFGVWKLLRRLETRKNRLVNRCKLKRYFRE